MASRQPAGGRRYLVRLQGEVHGNLCLYLDWLAVQDVGAVLPLFYCVERGWDQHGMASDQVQILDRSSFVDQGLQDD